MVDVAKGGVLSVRPARLAVLGVSVSQYGRSEERLRGAVQEEASRKFDPWELEKDQIMTFWFGRRSQSVVERKMHWKMVGDSVTFRLLCLGPAPRVRPQRGNVLKGPHYMTRTAPLQRLGRLGFSIFFFKKKRRERKKEKGQRAC